MDAIYTLTAVFIESKTRPAYYLRKTRDHRTWGWFKTKEEAMQSAIDSASFYCEDLYYTHVIIEKVPYAQLPYDHKPTWMIFKELETPIKKTHTDKDGIETEYTITYTAEVIDKAPEGMSNIVGWSMG